MLVLLVLFQFTPLREGLPIEAFFSLHGMYFNSRPCERGFEKKQNPFKESVISIHAPARGASLVNQGVEEDYLFQFTPLREGLLLCAKRMSNGCYFNSRPYERGFAVFLSDFASISVFQFMPLREGLQCIFVHWKETIISIHAPARGASFVIRFKLPVYSFQFTPLREGLPIMM